MVNVQQESSLHARYVVKEKLDEGGMGVVYLATDRLTGKDVALKQVKFNQIGASTSNETLSDSLDAKNALAQEFRAIASIRHPNIISVLDYGFLYDGSPFFTMDYLDEFSDFVTGGQTKSVIEKIELLIELLNTLEYLHRRGLLHRDIKPGNVALYQDHVKLLDFGLSVDAETIQSDDNMKIVGTIAYMAPEVLQGYKPTPSSDLYAVGIMAYEIFIGRHPFNLNNINMLIMDVISTMPDLSIMDTIRLSDPPLQMESETDSERDKPDLDTTMEATAVLASEDIPADITASYHPSTAKGSILRSVFEKLLAKDAEQRYSHAIDIIRELNFLMERSRIRQSDMVRESYLRSAKFVGREAELSILQDALEDTAMNHGSAWLIGGEVGVGKTRLIDELRVYALIKGYTVVSGHAVAHNNIPYQLWRDPVRRLLLNANVSDVDASVLKDLVSDIERLIERDVDDPEPLDGEKHKERLQLAILSMFQAVRAPVLLILEDIQWSPNSVDILNRLSSIITDKRIMVIATFLQDESENLPEQLPDFHLMELKRLNRMAIQVLSESIIGSKQGVDKLIDTLYRETDGNVYFMIEILRELALKSGSLHTIDAARLSTDVSSEGVHKILRQRLNKVTVGGLQLLKMMALEGRDIDLDVVNAIQLNFNLDQWFVNCSNLSILDTSEDGEWRFVHDAMRRTVLNTIADDERAELYGTLADAIESVHGEKEEYAQVLASHYREAGNNEKELTYARLAANYALHIGNLTEARDLYDRVLELLPQATDDTASLLSRADVEISLSKTLNYLGEYDRARDISVQTITTLRTVEDSKQLADAMIEHAEVLKRQGELAESEALVAEALGIATELGYQQAMVYAFDRLSDLSNEQGNYEQALTFANQGLALAEEIEDRLAQGSLQNNLGIIAFSQGQTDTAREHFTRAKEIYADSGQIRNVAALDMNLGAVMGQGGDLDTSLTYFESALETFRTIGEKRILSRIYSNLGFVASLKGDIQSSITYYEDGLTIARSIGIPVEIALILCNLGDANEQLGDVGEARQNFIEAIEIAHNSSATQATLSALGHMVSTVDNPTTALTIIGHILENPASNQEATVRANETLETIQSNHADINTEQSLATGREMVLDDVVALVLSSSS